jgi:hypothetical protein
MNRLLVGTKLNVHMSPPVVTASIISGIIQWKIWRNSALTFVPDSVANPDPAESSLVRSGAGAGAGSRRLGPDPDPRLLKLTHF